MTSYAFFASAVLMLAPLARADDRASDRALAGIQVYADSDGLTVVHPSATAAARVADETRIEARYDADVITAATIDVRTSASVRPFEEVRHGGRLAVTQELSRALALGGAYALSVAPDHQSHTLGVSVSGEDEPRAHRLEADLRGAYESVGRAGDRAPRGEVIALGGGLGWASVLARWLVLDLGAALEWRHGYLESPYRFVTVLGDAQEALRVPEQVPDDRVRASIRARLRAALGDHLFARASYRLHGDDWGIVGHTVELTASVQLARGWIASLGGRLLVQRGATFYQGTYVTLPELPLHRTRDRELAPGFAAAALVSLDAHLFDLPERFRFIARVRAEVLYHRFLDTPALPERTGVILGLTLGVER